MRQEVIYREKSLAVVNDSCATSPDGTIAALRRFTNAGGVVLIVGGTDKMLTFAELAREIKKTIPVEQLILLEGTATTKLLSALCDQGLAQSILRGRVFSTLSECVRESFQVAQSLRGNTTILFSPGAASFEKFLHEFDRGRQFNLLAQKNIVKK